MRMRWLLSLTLLLLMAPLLIAQDDDKEKSKQEKEEPTIAEQFRDVKRSHSKMMRELGAKFRKAKTPEDRSEIMKERTDLEAELSATTMKLVTESDDSDEQVDMLSWVAQNGSGDSKDAAVDQIMTDHIESEGLKTFASTLGRGQPKPNTEKMLRTLMEKSPHDSVKASATMAMVNFLQGLSRFADLPENVRSQVAKSLGEGGEEMLEKWTPESINEELIVLLETAAEKFGDVPGGRGKSIGEMAENQLFSIKYLQIGKIAPDIEGEDLDEVSFKLSDYRGKVVVLDFWGDW